MSAKAALRVRMTHEQPRCGVVRLIAATAAMAILWLPAALSAEPDPARPTMHQVFEALVILLPLSLDEQAFSAPERQEQIAREIGRLTGAAHALEQHGERRDMTFLALSRNLAADVEELSHRYRWGRLEEARFFVLEATRNCVACHARLPGVRDFPLGDRLLAGIDMSDRSVHELGQLFVATRQFDRALDAWEALFRDTRHTPAELEVGGYLLDYLTVAIRVKREPERAAATLRTLSKRKDLPRYLARRLETWTRDIDELAPLLTGGPSLVKARELVRQPLPDRDVADERDRLIRDLVASSLLLRFVDAHGRDSSRESQIAEAYYLLGIVGVRNVDAFWVPQAELQLEAAIRMDPTGPYANAAWLLLEESIAVGWGGVWEDVLPADVWARLMGLRQLIDAAQTSAQPSDQSK